MKCKYVVDTSVILRRAPHQYYDEESFPIHWSNFDKLIECGDIISTDLVKNELLKKDDNLKDWVEKYNYMFKELDSNVVFVLNELSNMFKGWYEFNSKKYAADPEVIAMAKAYNLVLVTQESYNGNAKSEKNFKIPTICEKIGAQCIINDMHNSYVHNKENFDFECICFSELIKREQLHNPSKFK